MNRSWLAPLTPIYGALLRAKNSAYTREWVKPQRLRGPVVSVGNLSVGGAGKTPFTIRLTELLLAQGWPSTFCLAASAAIPERRSGSIPRATRGNLATSPC